MFRTYFLVSAFFALATTVGLVRAAPIAIKVRDASSFSSDPFLDDRDGGHSGDATFFAPGLGACGATSAAADHIVALNPEDFQGGAKCHQNIEVHFEGKSVDAEVVDLCPGCAKGSIDLSPSAFDKLASADRGRIQVDWDFAKK